MPKHRTSQRCADVEQVVLHFIGVGGETTETNLQLETLLTGRAYGPNDRPHRFRRARKHMPLCPRGGGFSLGYRSPGRGTKVLALIDPDATQTPVLTPIAQRVEAVYTGMAGQFIAANTLKTTAVDQLRACAREAMNSGNAQQGAAIVMAAMDVERHGEITLPTAKALAAAGITL